MSAEDEHISGSTTPTPPTHERIGDNEMRDKHDAATTLASHDNVPEVDVVVEEECPNALIAEVARLRRALGDSERARKEVAQQREVEVAKLQQTVRALRAERAELHGAVRATRRKNEELHARLARSEELRAGLRRRAAERPPAERVLRRAFADKVEQLALTHARTTARMLNVQKRCFEEELESLEGEAHATVVAFERQFAKLRDDAAAKDEDHAREREAAFAKTAAVMAAVKRRIECADKALDMARCGRQRAEAAAKERHDALVGAVRERAQVRHELQRMCAEVGRKNSVIERLQHQLDAAIKELGRARACSAQAEKENLVVQQQAMPRRGAAAAVDVGKLGKLFASVIADFTASAQAELGAKDGVVVVDESPVVGATSHVANASTT